MIPNKNIFCNAPWFELQIYWDGSLGFCCAEHHKIYSETEKDIYNIKNMSITEWMNAEPMRRIRQAMFGDKELSICHRCQQEQRTGGTSRRHKSNAKSVLFTKTGFNESFEQSPHKDVFLNSYNNNGMLKTYPIDLHIDLGNYCNLACKMCGPYASSKIASQYKKWGIETDKKSNKLDKKILLDWTSDETVWRKTLNELLGFKNLENVHFMGGETILSKRFINFLDFMIENNKTDFGISFVTNGTIINYDVIERLKQFSKRVNIELSIETTTEHNSYIRQGTDTDQVLKHIEIYRNICNTQNWDFTIRPAVGLLSVGYYHTLLNYCLEHQLLCKALTVNDPEYLRIEHLPKHIKQQYLKKYIELTEKFSLEKETTNNDYNESDRHEYRKVIKKDINSIMLLLNTEQTSDSNEKLKEMVSWCQRWDKVYHYDAKKLYPEFESIFKEHGYEL